MPGIEPGSERMNTQASTCVGHILSLTEPLACDQNRVLAKAGSYLTWHSAGIPYKSAHKGRCLLSHQ